MKTQAQAVCRKPQPTAEQLAAMAEIKRIQTAHSARQVSGGVSAKAHLRNHQAFSGVKNGDHPGPETKSDHIARMESVGDQAIAAGRARIAGGALK